MHSLAELRRLAADESRKQAETAQRARLAAERERARIEQERADHERALRAAAESGLQAEIERLEAARRAQVGHTEHEAQLRRELELTLVEERNREQKRELARALEASRRRAWLAASWISSAALMLLGAGAYFGILRPESGQLAAALTAARSENASVRGDAEAKLARAHERETALASRVSELERAQRDAPIAPAAPHKAIAGPSPRAPKPPAPGARAPCGDTGDPLDPCLSAAHGRPK